MKHCIVPAKVVLCVILLALLTVSPVAAARTDTLSEEVCARPHSAYLAVDPEGKPLAECRADVPLVPASTLKILTAWLALDHWGADYRFHTDFYIDERQRLWIKGYGDPMLVSEELDEIVAGLLTHGVDSCSGLAIDESYFAPDIRVPGRSSSDNPYDAPVAALAVNFNTVNLLRKNGQLRSAEPQTPLTATARRIGAGMMRGQQRLRLPSQADSGRYFAELLQVRLATSGIVCRPEVTRGKVPATARLVYTHRNSRSLRDIVEAMLEYSTNFIANQLLLALGADVLGSPATFEKGTTVARQRIDEVLGWDHYIVEEGAGLSHDNRLSASQLVQLLQLFEPWKTLLPTRKAGVPAKTGTLKGVRTLAGYLDTSTGSKPFAILINDPAPVQWRYRLLRLWQKQLDSGSEDRD